MIFPVPRQSGQSCGCAADRDRLLLGDHPSGAAAALAGLRLGAGLRTGAAAARAGLTEIQLQRLLAAEHGLLKGNIDGGAYICPAHGAALRASRGPPASAEHAPEEIAEDIVHIHAAEIEALEAAVAASALFKRGVAELVILCPLLRIAEDRVGLRGLLELLRRLLVSRIHVRVIFLRELPVCLLQCRFVRIFVDAQHLIIISLVCHAASSKKKLHNSSP